MLMMLLLGVVYFFLRTGGLGCCRSVATGIQIMSAGQSYLGAPLGSQNFITDYTQDCVSHRDATI